LQYGTVSVTTSKDLSAAIAELWTRQRGEMLRRVDVVDAAVAGLAADTLTAEQRDEAERAAHKIAGAAGTFGFPAASRDARAIEVSLRAGVEHADAPRLADLALAVRLEFDGSPPDAAPPADEPADEPATANADVLVLCAGDDRAEAVTRELSSRGLTALVYATAADAAGAPHTPLALMDLAVSGADELVARLADGEPSVAVVGLAGDTSFRARVEFARRGGRVLLRGETPRHEVADAVASLRGRMVDQSARVLVVDDDPVLLEISTTILRRRGLQVIGLDDPTQFWDVLEANEPDVLLLDVEMPSVNGLELCRAVRADPRWSQLPVLFLTGLVDADSIRAVFAAGADDYLSKPVIEEELVQRIANRLERVRLYRELADRDPLTGLGNRRKSSEELERLVKLATRYGQPLSLAILDLDHFKGVNDTYGHEAGDDVLRRLGRMLGQEFRGEDAVGRWGGEEFVVGMYGMPGTVAVDRLTAVLNRWRNESFDDGHGGRFETAFSAGVAEVPGAAGSLEELQRMADEALYRAKAAGRCRVIAAGEAGATTAEAVDVALVEDDQALAELVAHALRAQGWSVRVLDEGGAAAEALAGDPPLLHARLVLLDWDLPGLDGLGVLRRLRDRGVLRATRVIMLTARTGEAEMVEALELGAADHVAKPFSVPVLLQKVANALGDR
jgi:diguanylate cyclase (GGDEF)-like protein